MLYSKDPKPVTCHSKEIWFDDLGTMHLKYFSNKHKLLRDFVFTSDDTKAESLLDVRNKMEDRISKSRFKRRFACVVGALILWLLVNVTVAVLYSLTH